MISLKLLALVGLTTVSVVAGSPPSGRSLSPLDVTLPSVGPPSEFAMPGACREAASRELRAPRQDLVAVKEKLRRERR